MTQVKKIERLYSAAPSPQNSRWNNWLTDRLARAKREVFSEQVEVGPRWGMDEEFPVIE